MARCLYIRVVILLCLVVPCAAFGQDSRSVRLVEITSRRSATSTTARRFNNPHKPADATENVTDLAITKEGDGYTLNGQTVDPHLIASLVNALTAPANAAPNLDDLGVTPAWLKEHAASVAQSVSESVRVGTKHVPQAALETIFADPAIMNTVVLEFFDRRPSTCFDCTRYRYVVTVMVTFDGGSGISASTSSQSPFMLPWRLSNGAAYNADISRAVVALMPEKSANRALLLSEHFDRQLGHAIVRQAMDLDVERRAGAALDALRAKYTIERASIGEFSDTALRGPVQPMPADSTVFFELRRSDAPDTFFGEELILPYVDGNVVGTDVFLQRAPQYEQLVLSVPWLNQFAQQNKGIVRSSVAFFHDVSLSDEAAQLFSQDMHALGRDELGAKTEAAKDQIAVLIVGLGPAQSEWLVFPDRHMVLWRYSRDPFNATPDLLEWKPVDFLGKPCTKTVGGFMGCVGEEISPDGAIIVPE
jgi:hypothetical protein